MLSLLAPLCDCGLLVPSALPCAEAALPGGGNTPPPLGQGQKRPAGEHFQLMFHELEIITWRLMGGGHWTIHC